MFVTVHLRNDLADEMSRSQSALPETLRLVKALAKRGVTLQPLHPGVGDPELSTHFFASVATDSDATELARDLVNLPGVIAAYAKPPDAAP